MNGMGGGITETYIHAMACERYAAARQRRLVKLAVRAGRARKAVAAAGNWCDTGRSGPAMSRHAD